MGFLASAANDGTTSDNIDRIFDGIFGIFDNLSEIGAGWGGPWEWLLPTFVGLFIFVAIFGGFGSVFDLSAAKARPIFVFALAIIALLAFVAIRGDSELGGDSNSLAVFDDS